MVCFFGSIAFPSPSPPHLHNANKKNGVSSRQRWMWQDVAGCGRMWQDVAGCGRMCDRSYRKDSGLATKARPCRRKKVR